MVNLYKLINMIPKIKKILILCISFFCIQNYFGQTQFQRGYFKGYATGYCYEKDYGCIPKVPFLAPNPTLEESSNSFIDGYNRGLIEASITYKPDQSKQNSYSIYGQQHYIPKVAPFKPNYNLYYAVMSQLSVKNSYIQQDTKTAKSEVELELDKLIKELEEPNGLLIREGYINLVKKRYKSFNKYPDKIPNGSHKVVILQQTNDYGEGGKYKSYYEGYAYIENNNITDILITLSSTDGLIERYYWSIESFPEKLKERGNYLSSVIYKCYPFNKGIVEYESSIYSHSTGKFLESSQGHEKYKVYFLDFIDDFVDADYCSEAIRAKYYSQPKPSSIKNGWNMVYAIGLDYPFCYVSELKFNDGKIISYRESIDNEYEVIKVDYIGNNHYYIHIKINKESRIEFEKIEIFQL